MSKPTVTYWNMYICSQCGSNKIKETNYKHYSKYKCMNCNYEKIKKHDN